MSCGHFVLQSCSHKVLTCHPEPVEVCRTVILNLFQNPIDDIRYQLKWINNSLLRNLFSIEIPKQVRDLIFNFHHDGHRDDWNTAFPRRSAN
jgi:hypothetical protein